MAKKLKQKIRESQITFVLTVVLLFLWVPFIYQTLQNGKTASNEIQKMLTKHQEFFDKPLNLLTPDDIDQLKLASEAFDRELHQKNLYFININNSTTISIGGITLTVIFYLYYRKRPKQLIKDSQESQQSNT